MTKQQTRLDRDLRETVQASLIDGTDRIERALSIYDDRDDFALEVETVPSGTAFDASVGTAFDAPAYVVLYEHGTAILVCYLDYSSRKFTSERNGFTYHMVIPMTGEEKRYGNFMAFIDSLFTHLGELD